MGTRRKSREAALQIFFQLDFNGQNLGELFKLYWAENLVAPEIRLFTEELCLGTLAQRDAIDALIEKHSTNWKMSRMTHVDRSILRLATYELVYLPEIPSSVTINEALEIAKKYGTDESAAFINGILDQVSKESRRDGD